MLPPEYINELSKLRFDVKPMDYDEILDVLQKELDKTQFPIFKSVDKEVLGSASIVISTLGIVVAFSLLPPLSFIMILKS